MIKLRGGNQTGDIRVDRIEEFDERSKNYSISSINLDKKLRSYTWRCWENFDQGAEGACVGFGVAHELAARPAEVQGLSNQFAKEEIYWPAQKSDRWDGGSYPGANPFYEGTSVLAGVKVARKLGYFHSYRWAFGLRDLQLGIGYNGPAVMGLPWYEGMYQPDSSGYTQPTGKKIGGHCILCNAISIKHQRFTLHNSWGSRWGMNGECYISFSDMEKLLAQGGEAVFFLNRHGKAS